MITVLACATVVVAWWKLFSLAREKHLYIEPVANLIPLQAGKEVDR